MIGVLGRQCLRVCLFITDTDGQMESPCWLQAARRARLPYGTSTPASCSRYVQPWMVVPWDVTAFSHRAWYLLSVSVGDDACIDIDLTVDQVMVDAHDGSVCSTFFLPSQPLLLTTGSDNSVKVLPVTCISVLRILPSMASPADVAVRPG